jgi:hypothetical protein
MNHSAHLLYLAIASPNTSPIACYDPNASVPPFRVASPISSHLPRPAFFTSHHSAPRASAHFRRTFLRISSPFALRCCHNPLLPVAPFHLASPRLPRPSASSPIRILAHPHPLSAFFLRSSPCVAFCISSPAFSVPVPATIHCSSLCNIPPRLAHYLCTSCVTPIVSCSCTCRNPVLFP